MLFSLQDVFNELKLRQKKRQKEKLESKFCSGHLDGFSLSCSPIPAPFFPFFVLIFFFWMRRKGKTERKSQRSMWGDRLRLCSDCNSIKHAHADLHCIIAFTITIVVRMNLFPFEMFFSLSWFWEIAQCSVHYESCPNILTVIKGVRWMIIVQQRLASVFGCVFAWGVFALFGQDILQDTHIWLTWCIFRWHVSFQDILKCKRGFATKRSSKSRRASNDDYRRSGRPGWTYQRRRISKKMPNGC